jgi:hypothetical protein
MAQSARYQLEQVPGLLDGYPQRGSHRQLNSARNAGWVLEGQRLRPYCDFPHVMAKILQHILAEFLGQKPVESKQA